MSLFGFGLSPVVRFGLIRPGSRLLLFPTGWRGLALLWIRNRPIDPSRRGLLCRLAVSLIRTPPPSGISDRVLLCRLLWVLVLLCRLLWRLRLALDRSGLSSRPVCPPGVTVNGRCGTRLAGPGRCPDRLAVSPLPCLLSGVLSRLSRLALVLGLAGQRVRPLIGFVRSN